MQNPNFIIKLSLILLLTSVAIPSSGYATDCDEYINLRSGYYHLDEQKFNNLTCQIDSPTITENIASITKDIEETNDLGGCIKVQENISEFRLFFDKQNGFSYHVPNFTLESCSSTKGENNSSFKEMSENFEKGIGELISGIKSLLESVLDDYVTHKIEDFIIKKINNNSKNYSVSYTRKEDEIIESFDNSNLTTT